MSIFYMAASDSEVKERCKATTVGLAKREATRRFSQPDSDGYIYLIEIEAAGVDAGLGAGKILSSYARYAARGNRWFRRDLILEFDTLVIMEKLK